MAFQIFLTADAVRDLEMLYDYIYEHDAPEKAEYVLGQIEKAYLSLSENPNRGSYPKELQALGLREYRELGLNPYRMVYRVFGENVYIMLIADGRRDMQVLLQRRLFQS